MTRLGSGVDAVKALGLALRAGIVFESADDSVADGFADLHGAVGDGPELVVAAAVQQNVVVLVSDNGGCPGTRLLALGELGPCSSRRKVMHTLGSGGRWSEVGRAEVQFVCERVAELPCCCAWLGRWRAGHRGRVSPRLSVGIGAARA